MEVNIKHCFITCSIHSYLFSITSKSQRLLQSFYQTNKHVTLWNQRFLWLNWWTHWICWRSTTVWFIILKFILIDSILFIIFRLLEAIYICVWWIWTAQEPVTNCKVLATAVFQCTHIQLHGPAHFWATRELVFCAEVSDCTTKLWKTHLIKWFKSWQLSLNKYCQLQQTDERNSKV
jgi:hypothetical protein